MSERDPKKRTVEENQAEYVSNMHAIQSCIALGMNNPEVTKFGDHKHMQVGIFSAMITDHAIAELLIAKGIFTHEEYVAQLVISTREELERLTIEAAQRIGTTIEKLRFQ